MGSEEPSLREIADTRKRGGSAPPEVGQEERVPRSAATWCSRGLLLRTGEMAQRCSPAQILLLGDLAVFQGDDAVRFVAEDRVVSGDDDRQPLVVRQLFE